MSSAPADPSPSSILSLYDGIADPLLLLDVSSRVLAINTKAEALLGPSASIVNQSIESIFPQFHQFPITSSSSLAAVAAAKQKRMQVHDYLSHSPRLLSSVPKKNNSSAIEVEISIGEKKLASGSAYYICTVREVSSRYRASSPSAPASSPVSAFRSRFESDFEKLEPLGSGAFGSVWKCRNRIDECLYAVKQVALDSPFQQSKRNEKEIAKKLKEISVLAQMPPHPNVIRYFSSWTEKIPLAALDRSIPIEGMEENDEEFYDSKPLGKSLPTGLYKFSSAKSNSVNAAEALVTVMYIQMNLCHSATLKEWLENPDRTVDSDANLLIFVQLINGIAHIHECNYIHRDLKPSNLLLDPATNAVLIADFGLATKHQNSDIASPLAGSLPGSPRHSAVGIPIPGRGFVQLSSSLPVSSAFPFGALPVSQAQSSAASNRSLAQFGSPVLRSSFLTRGSQLSYSSSSNSNSASIPISGPVSASASHNPGEYIPTSAPIAIQRKSSHSSNNSRNSKRNGTKTVEEMLQFSSDEELDMDMELETEKDEADEGGFVFGPPEGKKSGPQRIPNKKQGKHSRKGSDHSITRKKNPNLTSGLGSKFYSSPEQLKSSKYDSSTDIFASGVILAEMFSPPFASLMGKYRELEMVRVGKVPPHIEKEYPAVAELLERMLSLDPTERPTATEILEMDFLQPAVQQLRQSLPIPERSRSHSHSRSNSRSMSPFIPVPSIPRSSSVFVQSPSDSPISSSKRNSLSHSQGSHSRSHSIPQSPAGGAPHPAFVRSTSSPQHHSSSQAGLEPVKESEFSLPAHAASPSSSRRLFRMDSGSPHEPLSTSSQASTASLSSSIDNLKLAGSFPSSSLAASANAHFSQLSISNPLSPDPDISLQQRLAEATAQYERLLAEKEAEIARLKSAIACGSLSASVHSGLAISPSGSAAASPHAIASPPFLG